MSEYMAYKGEGYTLTWQTEMPTSGITQVSGLVFDENGFLLIVHVDEQWALPGGKPEKFETPEQTLMREVWEEANVTIKNIHFLGAVKVVPDNPEKAPHYQLRYRADVQNIEEYQMLYEATRRAFVGENQIDCYILWAKGSMFKHALNAAKKG